MNKADKRKEEHIEEITDGQASVLLYYMWQEMLLNGEVPDCKRYRDEFFDYYGECVKSENAPFYLMFCAFVGGIDMSNFIDVNNGGAANE